MSEDVQAFIDAGLARGLSAKAIIAAAQARLAQPRSQPTLAPSQEQKTVAVPDDLGGGSQTVWFSRQAVE